MISTNAAKVHAVTPIASAVYMHRIMAGPILKFFELPKGVGRGGDACFANVLIVP